MTSDPPAAHGGWRQVAEVKQLYEGELIALRLQEAGIEARLLDQSYNQEPMPDVRSLALVRVLVPAGQLEDARLALATPSELPEDAEQASAEASEVPTED